MVILGLGVVSTINNSFADSSSDEELVGDLREVLLEIIYLSISAHTWITSSGSGVVYSTCKNWCINYIFK
jgi:hypothetical protein